MCITVENRTGADCEEKTSCLTATRVRQENQFWNCIPVMASVIAGYAEARETSTLLIAVRAFLEVFQSSLLGRKAANDLLITYLRAEAVVLTA